MSAAKKVANTTSDVKLVASSAEQISDAQRLKDFRLGAGQTYIQYGDLLTNPEQARFLVQNNAMPFKRTEYVPDLEQVVKDGNSRIDYRAGSKHTYRYQKEGKKWYAYVNPKTYHDPKFAGAKFGAEAVLANITKSVAKNSIYIPNNLRYLVRENLQDDAFKTMADLMAAKVVTKTTSRFSNITDSEIFEVAKEC